MRISSYGREVILDILLGKRSHKDLKIAFDWEDTSEGFQYWTRQRQAATLSRECHAKLASAISFVPPVASPLARTRTTLGVSHTARLMRGKAEFALT